MTTLYLVRHGETIDNAAQILQGQLQGELNEKGIQQAEATRDKLKNEQIDVFVWRQRPCSESATGVISRASSYPI